jgi:hypothetical protein
MRESSTKTLKDSRNDATIAQIIRGSRGGIHSPN